ncbi:exodeoxyribonuclease III [Candidatus Falkowbacteria bacterium CG10_big_fil_rev_8_21_14_0_10_37_14]|uniref:Exodeoxyribonuclease III n=1 Tax=Candidatus Falkowbacteria bacterium CG10_big_fil_rev_8_21_14_0_10_37_14 TaxID=1974561 RepID=A0A2M6WU94_9BACT|nr:exodeoxyribonuclease III [Candidatus Falkowbacteria bacterium]PIT96306.1 MAG: exodeoxyribonuclease III [Candidatus Falkowbacteria bacterium CG10_big_fil_rev_8_21_14_0_10_37_14]
MIIVSWNVNGIRACVKNGFERFLADRSPDVLCLQEIKIDSVARSKHDFDFNNYEEYWNPAEKKGYSGTAILSKKPIVVKNGLDIKEFDNEGRVETADLGDFYLINAYYPNARALLVRLDYKERFNEAILAYAKKLEKTKPVIMTGDFNVAREEIDLARPKENVGQPGFSDEERTWGRQFLREGFVDTFRELHKDKVQYSWWSYRGGARPRNVGWRIDYFLASKALMPRIKRAEIWDEVLGSDHAPVMIEIV